LKTKNWFSIPVNLKVSKKGKVRCHCLLKRKRKKRGKNRTEAETGKKKENKIKCERNKQNGCTKFKGDIVIQFVIAVSNP
jgi:hypothetical protein